MSLIHFDPCVGNASSCQAEVQERWPLVVNAALQAWSSYFENVLGVRQVLRADGAVQVQPEINRPNFVWLVEAPGLTDSQTELIQKMTSALQVPDAKVVLVSGQDLEIKKAQWLQMSVPEMVVVSMRGPTKTLQKSGQTRWVEISGLDQIATSQEHKRNVWNVLKTLMSGRGQ